MAADAQNQYELANWGFAVPGMTFWGDSPTLLEITTTKTQTGKSRITLTVTRAQTGKARITAATTRTQTGKARITNSATKTQTGTSRITAITSRTQTGKARITAITTRDQTGKAAILPYGLLFSYENTSTLPTDDDNLANLFTADDYVAVETDDTDYRCETGSNTYNVFLFKYLNTNNDDNIDVSWTAKSDVALSTKTAYLQIYNYLTSTWETLDTDNTTAADTEFTLTGAITADQSDYYDGSNWIAVRGYQ